MKAHWKTVIAAIVLAGAASSVAIADGYEPAGKGFAAPTAYNWTGAYAGVHARGAWSADTSAALSGDPITVQPTLIELIGVVPQSLDPNPSGFIGGVQAGYNWRRGPVVFGFEADISYSSLDDGDNATLSSEDVPYQTSLDTDIEWFSTVRGRIGVLPHDRWMVFATGGLAFGKTQQTLRLANLSANLGSVFGNPPNRLACPSASTCLAGSHSEISVGWTGGGGFEFAVSDDVTLKGEYLYVDLGSSSVTATPTQAAIDFDSSPGGPFLRAKVENQLNVIRVGLNVKLY